MMVQDSLNAWLMTTDPEKGVHADRTSGESGEGGAGGEGEGAGGAADMRTMTTVGP